MDLSRIAITKRGTGGVEIWNISTNVFYYKSNIDIASKSLPKPYHITLERILHNTAKELNGWSAGSNTELVMAWYRNNINNLKF